MNTTKRILVVHPEAQAGQTWQQALGKVGIETVLISQEEEARVVFDETPFALVLIAESAESEKSFEFAGELRRLQPDVPVVMVLRAVKLPLVVQGIRFGLTDVMSTSNDLAPMVKRVMVLLERAANDELSEDELAAAEATLAQFDPEYAQEEDRQAEERPQATWAQQMRELTVEQNKVEAAKEAVDRKARLLAQDREAMQRERQELKAERIQLEETLGELEVREENLRMFENTLRAKQEKIDKELVVDHSKLPGTAIDLAQAWEAHNRAAKILDAGRAAFRDERMVLTDLDKQIKERSERLKELDSQLSSREIKRRGHALPPPKAFANSGSKTGPPRKVGFFRSILGDAR
jgi:DNA-binding response OmpR family regulator